MSKAVERFVLVLAGGLLLAGIVMLFAEWDRPSGTCGWLSGAATVLSLAVCCSAWRRGRRRG